MAASRRIQFLLPALASLAYAPLFAAENPGAATIESLTAEVAALKAKIEQVQKDAGLDTETVRGDLQVFRDLYDRFIDRTTVKTATDRFLVLSGTIRTRAYAGSLDNSRGEATYGADIPLATVNFNGTLFRDFGESRNLVYRFGLTTSRGAIPANYINVTKSPITGEFAADPSTVNTTIAVADALIQYNWLSSADLEGNRLTTTFGQFTPRFGATASDEVQPNIRSTLAAATVVPGRQIGLELAGDFSPSVDVGADYRVPLFAYWFAATNGAANYSPYGYTGASNVQVTGGGGANAGDNNNTKALFGRVEFIPPHDYNSLWRQLKLGVGASLDYSTAVATQTRASVQPFVPVIGENLGDDSHQRIAADATYTNSFLNFSYEFVRSFDETTAQAVVPAGFTDAQAIEALNNPATKKQRGTGHAVTVGYIWGDQFLANLRNPGKFDDSWPTSYQPYVRYDVWDPDSDTTDDSTDVWSLGANIFFTQTTKFQIQASRINNRAVDGLFREVLAQFQFGF